MIREKEETMKLMKVGTRLWRVLNVMFLRSIHVVACYLLFYCQVAFYSKNIQFVYPFFY